MHKFLLIALAGAAGASLRYGSYVIANRFISSTFPWTTITVNAIGCFIFGLVYALSVHKMVISAETRIIILVGFTGAFTTLSAIAFETFEFMRLSQWTLAAGNLVFESVAMVIAIYIGVTLGRII